MAAATIAGPAIACRAPESNIAPSSTPTGEPSPTVAASQGYVPVLIPTQVVSRTRTPSVSTKPSVTPYQSLRTGPPAQDFQLDLMDGETLSLSDLEGEVVVLNFWASWCPPCRWEMPAFERMWREYRDRGVVFLGIAVSDREEDARAFADKVGVTYPLGVDTTGQIVRAYQVTSMPTTFFIDRQGNIARKLANPANEGVLRLFLKGQLGEGW